MVSAWATGMARESTQTARTALMWDMVNVGGEPIYSLKWAVGQGTSWWCPKSGHYLLVQSIGDTFHSHPIQADPGLRLGSFPARASYPARGSSPSLIC